MNKKFAFLLIPLMLIPLMSYGYAHFTDEVQKKYKVHVGSVYLNVTGFHVDYAKIPDVDNDGVIMGDELNITIFEADDCRWYVLIEANPITGGFILNTTMKMHNGGKLPFVLRWTVLWDGPHDTDPCYDLPAPYKLLSGNPPPNNGSWTPTHPERWDLPMPPWSWAMEVRKENASGTFGPFGPTETHYKPCNNITVKQHINFKQPDPSLYPGSWAWQKDWQCKWIRIWIVFEAEDAYETVSSWTWP